MIKFSQMHFSRNNTLSRGISFLNKLKKNRIFFNSSLMKFGFSTNDIYNNTFSHENSFHSLNESLSLNRSHMFSEFGAKKIKSIGRTSIKIVHFKPFYLPDDRATFFKAINKLSPSTKANEILTQPGYRFSGSP